MNFVEKVKKLQNYFTNGNFKRVIEGCDILNKKFPNNSFILNLSGMAHQRLDKDYRAINLFELALKADNNNIAAMNNLASSLKNTEQYFKAEQIFKNGADKISINTALKDKKLVEAKLKISEDRANRNQVMTGLLAPLSKDKKELMTELLETVKTEKLEDSFNKYLPSVINEEVSVRTKKAVINESVTSEHTGDKNVQTSTEDGQDIVEIENIRKLAGLSN